jgi:hypothetical protein
MGPGHTSGHTLLQPFARTPLFFLCSSFILSFRQKRIQIALIPAEDFCRVEGVSILTKFEVKVRSGGLAGGADLADKRAGFNARIPGDKCKA